MTLRSWRIVKAKFSGAAFTGEGSASFGGRWNSIGVPVVYTAESLSLATLEILVGGYPLNSFGGYVRFPVDFDESMVEVFPVKKLPKSWASYPAVNDCRTIGDLWVKDRRSAVLRVPSAVIQEECNYVINPLHPDFGKVIIGKPEALPVDRRLMQ